MFYMYESDMSGSYFQLLSVTILLLQITVY